MCVRTLDRDGYASDGRPVAWVLIHYDGSIGALHVDVEYRRRGLVHLVVYELIKRCSGENNYNVGGGGALGWNSTDVMRENDKAVGFMGSLDGWKEGWLCYWIFLTAGEV